MTNTWQLISTAPTDGTVVDLWTAEGFRVVNCEYGDSHWSNEGDVGNRQVTYTHWMLVAGP